MDSCSDSHLTERSTCTGVYTYSNTAHIYIHVYVCNVITEYTGACIKEQLGEIYHKHKGRLYLILISNINWVTK